MEKYLKYIIWVGLIGICFIPLIVNSGFYFPFIVPKTVVFRIAVEVLFLLYLLLAIKNKTYRLKLNLVLVLFSLYLFFVSISSLLGSNFYFSFWGNNERSEGLLLLLHLLLYLIVLSGFLKDIKSWLLIFDASYLSGVLVSLIALGQYLKLSWVMASSGGSRLTATIGNAGYVAGYLIFNILFGLFLFFFRRNKFLRFYYLAGIALQIFVVFNTLTRGGILALCFSLFVFAVYLLFFRLKIGHGLKAVGVGIVLIPIIFGALVFLNKQATWVTDNELLNRIASISASDVTADNRLLTWQSSWEGFLEKPVFGYGYENFYSVFDRYFKPQIYRKAASVVWFDRAHNIIFDRLVTGGLIGLLLYLALLFVPLIYLWRYFKKHKNKNGNLVPVIFVLIMVAYFIQNLFIFEALVTYLPLFLTLAFLSQFCPDYLSGFYRSKKPYLGSLVIGVILFLPILFNVNIKPTLANRGFIEAMFTIRSGDYKKAFSKFEEVLAMNTANNQEYRQHFGEFIVNTLDDSKIDDNWKANAVLKGKQEFEHQIAEKGESARNYLMYIRFLDRTYRFNVDYLNIALQLSEKAISLSPTRPQTYYERGYVYYYLGKYYKDKGEADKAKDSFDQSLANMQTALELNDKVVESYVNVVMVALMTDRGDLIQQYLDRMDGLKLIWRDREVVERVANSAVRAQNYEWTRNFYQELIQLDANNPGYMINLALSYAYLGDSQKAIEIAEQIKKMDAGYIEQADAFIKDIQAGKFSQ